MSIFQEIKMIGGPGGTLFSALGGTNGKVVEKIGVWVGPYQLTALRVWLTDDEPKTFGTPRGPYKEFSFNPGERITRLSLWDNGGGSRAGWVYFETSQGRAFNHGMTKGHRRQEHPVDVGSGILVGVTGNSASDVDKLGLVFLKRIRSAVLCDVNYPSLSFDSEGIAPETIDVFCDENTGAIPRNWKFSGRRTMSTTSSWSFTVGLEVHAEVSVEASIPAVAKISGKTGWKLSASTTHAKSELQSHDLSWEESGTLAPGGAINLQALTRRGQISIPYNGVFRVLLHDNTSFEFPVEGIYEGLTYTGVEITEISLVELQAFRAFSLAFEPPAMSAQPVLATVPQLDAVPVGTEA